MSAEADLRRLRGDANKLRADIGKASRDVATSRRKAHDASAAADRSKSASTVKMKLAEAQRATKAANDAEARRAGLEKKLADVEVKITKAQEKYEKERKDSQKKALDDLRRRSDRAAAQFGPPPRHGDPPSAPPPRSYPVAAVNAKAAAPDEAADVFLSHASEDKEDIARPLRDALEARDVSVWFDEIRIKVGQSIRREIEAGIAACRFGVVVVSPAFFSKEWTQAELDALFGKKMDTGADLLLPIWHRISKDEVSRRSPLLAGILALNSSIMTVDEMADALTDVVRA